MQKRNVTDEELAQAYEKWKHAKRDLDQAAYREKLAWIQWRAVEDERNAQQAA